jgi:tetratricopeptide (TPR) repeat protein
LQEAQKAATRAEAAAPSSDVEQQLAAANKERTALEIKLAQAQSRIGVLEAAQAAIAVREQRLEEARKQLSLEASPDAVKAAALQKELDALRAQTEKQQAEAAKLDAELQQTKQALEKSEAQVKELSARLKAAGSAPAPVQPVTRPQSAVPAPSPAPAVAAVESAARLPEALKPQVSQAESLLAKGDLDGAAAIYEKILQEHPQSVLALGNLAVIRLQQNKLDDAETLLRRATRLAPDDAFTYSVLGVVLYSKGSLDDALAALSRAIALDPKNAENFNYRGITLSKKGWDQAAETELRRAIDLRPEYGEAHYNLAAVYLKQKPAAPQLAKLHYQRALALGQKADPALEKSLEEKLSGAKPEAAPASASAPAPVAPQKPQ